MFLSYSNSNEKVEIYYPKPQRFVEASHSPGKDSLLVKVSSVLMFNKIKINFFFYLPFKQDETFPELGIGSVEGCDDQESICSSNDREGDAFPKAFERELVTPTNLQKAVAAPDTAADAADKAAVDNADNGNNKHSFFFHFFHNILIFCSNTR